MRNIRPLVRLTASLAAATALLPPSGAAAQHAVALTAQPPRSITGIRFRFVADGPIRGGFGLAGNRLLFGTESGSIYALDARDGRVLWRRAAGSPVLSTPALLGGRAYFTTWDNALHAVDIVSGRELWRRDLGRTLGPNDYWEYYVSSPIISGGRLYVGSGGGRMFAIDPANGRIVWWADLGARIRTTPLVLSEKVIVGTMMGHVVALDRKDGRQLWTFATEGAPHDFKFKSNDTRSVVTEPIAVGDTVIAGGRDGNIYGVDLATGRERWRETHDGGSWILGFASDGARFYSASGSAFIMQAANPATGHEVWRTPTGSAMFGGVAEAGGVLVSNGSLGNLFGFDAASGAQLWQLRLPDMSFASPLIAAGAVFTGTDDGSVVAADTSASAPVPFDRYVYTYTNQPDAGFFWFKPEVVATIRDDPGASGFARVGNQELGALLAKPIGDHGRRIIVLGDTRLPDQIDGALVRKYLDGGGIVVMVGVNPLSFKFDANGAPAGQDEAQGAAVFGLPAPDLERDNGYNLSVFLPRARRFGLSGSFVANRWMPPDQISVPLALDRSGKATAWVKRFGNGGLLINLPIARFRAKELAPIINGINLLAAAAEQGTL
jgi:outer membrane protein assembly factor BamB